MPRSAELPVQRAGRVCDHGSCSTLLCRYNLTKRCWVHGGWIEIATHGEQRKALQDVMAGLL